MQHKTQSATNVASNPTPAEIAAIRKENPVSAGLNGLPDRVMLRPEVEIVDLCRRGAAGISGAVLAGRPPCGVVAL